jgi:hypothetical protein
MSAACQPSGSPGTGKIARQPQIGRSFQTELSAVCGRVAAKKGRAFDPHAFLATIGEGRKSVLF